MIHYIIRRLVAVIPVWIGVTILAFVLGSFAPGNAALAKLGGLDRAATPQEIARLERELGLDQPILVRYLAWVAGAAHADLGKSLSTGRPVFDELKDRFPATLQLAIAATLLSIVVAIPLGALAAVKRNSLVDHFARSVALAGASLPGFWMAYLLILLFAVTLHVLPVAGIGSPENLVLPAVTLSFGAMAVLTRLTRSAMLEVLSADYVRTARAKGLTPWRVIASHAYRNAQLPLVTLFGLELASLLGGAAIAETIFAWPGIGKFVVDAIGKRDYPSIQGFVVFTGTVFVLMNLAVDLAYGVIDPRIRLSRS